MPNTKDQQVVPPQKNPKPKPKDLKSTVMSKLIKCQNQVLDQQHRTFKTFSIPLKDFEDLQISPIALEVVGKDPNVEESPKVKAEREQITSIIQEVVDDVDINGEQIILVNVKTPAVDLEKNMDTEQLKFIKGDIFNNIKSQLGVEFHDQIEEQWGMAFNTMMEIVKNQKSSN